MNMNYGNYSYITLDEYISKVDVKEVATGLAKQCKLMVENGWDDVINNMDEDLACDVIRIYYGGGGISLEEFQSRICYGNRAPILPNGEPFAYAGMHDNPDKFGNYAPNHQFKSQNMPPHQHQNQNGFHQASEPPMQPQFHYPTPPMQTQFYQPINYQTSPNGYYNQQNCYTPQYSQPQQHQNQFQGGFQQASTPPMQTQYYPPVNCETPANSHHNKPNCYVPYYSQPQQFAPQDSSAQVPYKASMPQGPHHVMVHKDTITTSSAYMKKKESKSVESVVKTPHSDVAPLASSLKPARGKNCEGKIGSSTSVGTVVKVPVKIITDSQKADSVKLPMPEIQELSITKDLEKLDFLIKYREEKVDSPKKAENKNVHIAPLDSKSKHEPSSFQNLASPKTGDNKNEICASQSFPNIIQKPAIRGMKYSEILKKNTTLSSTSLKDKRVQAENTECQQASLEKPEVKEKCSDVEDGWMTQKLKKSKNRAFIPKEVKKYRIIDKSRKLDDSVEIEIEDKIEEKLVEENIEDENQSVTVRKKKKRARNGRRGKKSNVRKEDNGLDETVEDNDSGEKDFNETMEKKNLDEKKKKKDLNKKVEEKNVEVASTSEYHQKKEEEKEDIRLKMETKLFFDPVHREATRKRNETRWIIIEISVINAVLITCPKHPLHKKTACVVMKHVLDEAHGSFKICNQCAADPVTTSNIRQWSLFNSITIETAIKYNCNLLTAARVEEISPYLPLFEACCMFYSFGLDMPSTSDKIDKKKDLGAFTFTRITEKRNGVVTFDNFKHYLAGFFDLIKQWKDDELVVKKNFLVEKVVQRYLNDSNMRMVDSVTKKLVWETGEASKDPEFAALVLYSLRKNSEVTMDFLTLLFLFEQEYLG